MLRRFVRLCRSSKTTCPQGVVILTYTLLVITKLLELLSVVGDFVFQSKAKIHAVVLVFPATASVDDVSPSGQSRSHAGWDG